jgi:hypothetical protein
MRSPLGPAAALALLAGATVPLALAGEAFLLLGGCGAALAGAGALSGRVGTAGTAARRLLDGGCALVFGALLAAALAGESGALFGALALAAAREVGDRAITVRAQVGTDTAGPAALHLGGALLAAGVGALAAVGARATALGTVGPLGFLLAGVAALALVLALANVG